MGIVNVTHLERSAVTGKSSGSERGETALMCKLGQRIGLVHEL